ncbi:MAG: aminotransferase class V-fold PLP-dependent enzyme [Alphaproteobacteria bacterium]|jgi:selenocysteine lyase/cysteine desulfurase|nr:aminotransferase class V-fold PLP-dependent enzyme [Alphaproteobacteria bacterium]MDP6564213.1 aminotransferase class V-fold PLP-dependent enzyme [Alphaproteobacteria bacterium]MDP6815722.1 aminotransferase class V-fold PLP-dependent enzyme [Alphaproteobacteria bacterium]
MLTSQRDLFDIPRDICYLNAAAWSPLPIGAVELGQAGAAKKAHPWEIPEDFGRQQFERARAAAAGLINAEIDDIALISSVGYGVSTAAKVLDLPRNSRILVLENDHTAPVLEWLARAEAQDLEIETVRPGDDHDWTSALLEAIAKRAERPLALVSISSVHWSDGGLVDLDRVQEALRAQGAGLLIDATHAAGVLSYDVASLDPDFMIFPTYKWLLGPYGRAFIYVAKRHQGAIPLEQTSYGRKRVQAEDERYFTDLDYVDDARRFDMGERDFFVSMDVASYGIELLQAWGLDRVRERLEMLTERIASGLAERRVPVTMPRADLRAPHVLGLGFPNGMPEDLAGKLAEHRVYAAPRLGRLRISPHVYNDETDCDRFVEVLANVVQ